MGNRFFYNMPATLAIQLLNQQDDELSDAVIDATDAAAAAAISAAAAQAALETLELTSTVSLGGPAGGESLRVLQAPPSAAGHLEVSGSSAGGAVHLYAAGAEPNLPINISGQGTGNVNLIANGAVGFNVGNPVGAISNYRVRGASDANGPVIEPTGAATDITANVASKGNAAIRFFSHSYVSGAGREMLRLNPSATATNYLAIAPSPAGQRVSLSAQGSDTNRGITLTAAGLEGIEHRSNGTTVTYASNPANAISYISFSGNIAGARATMAVQSSVADSGINIQAKGAEAIGLVANSAEQVRITPHSGTSNSVIGMRGGTTVSRAAIFPIIVGAGNDRGMVLTALGNEGVEMVSNSATAMYVINPPSVTNYARVSGAPSGNSVVYTADGPDAAIRATIAAKGSAEVVLAANNAPQFLATGPQSAVNYGRVIGAVSGGSVVFEGAGSDTHVNVVVRPQGSGGELRLHSAGSERLRLDSAGKLVAVGNLYEVLSASGHLRLRAYTVATLPSASPQGQMIYLTDGTNNKRLAVSDGVNWRWPDGASVS